MLRVTHGGTDLHKLLDRLLNLIVEEAAIRHYDDRIKKLFPVPLECDELVSERGGSEAKRKAASKMKARVLQAD